MGNAVNFLKTVWGKPHGGSRDERKRRERAQTAKVSKNYEKTVDKNKKITYNTNSKVAKATAERHSKEIPSLFVTGFCL